MNVIFYRYRKHPSFVRVVRENIPNGRRKASRRSHHLLFGTNPQIGLEPQGSTARQFSCTPVK